MSPPWIHDNPVQGPAIHGRHDAAVCDYCRFERASGPHTLQDVKDHAAATGHAVRVGTETISVYVGVRR
jgi:hypothetical protein